MSRSCRWAEAEQKKISEGFVSLGGAYEEPENPHQAAISKIARQFMTRLHIQVNQTMQFYRGQQGGSAPQRLFLSGGASLMPYTAQFFAEKLNVPVEYFNPFRNVQIDPGINLEELARVAHALGEVVGLGLRNLAHCPVELNLMPESTLNWVQFNQKKPYFIATVFSLVLVVFASGYLFKNLAAVNQDELNKLQETIRPLQEKAEKFKRTLAETKKTQLEADQFASWMQDRYYWADVLTELHGVLITVEAGTTTKLGTPTGVWIEKFISTPLADEPGTPGAPMTPIPPPNRRRRPEPTSTSGDGSSAPAPAVQEMPVPASAPGAPTPGGASKASTNEVSSVTIVCRGVDLSTASGDPSANQVIAFALDQALKGSPLFDPAETGLAGDINSDPATGTFTFGVKLKLKRPMKF